MARGLKVKKFDAGDNVNYEYLSAYRLRLVIDEAVEMDDRVFLFRRDPVNPYTNEATDTFVTVCSPVDMADYPPEEPDPAKQYPFFRKNAVELDFRATSQAADAYALILRELHTLVFALNRLDRLREADSQWVGTAPGDDGSSSDSTEA